MLEKKGKYIMNNFDFKTYLKNFPNKDGFFGRFGGNFTPQELQKPLEEITKAYLEISKDPSFIRELEEIRTSYQGRPTPIYYCERLSNKLGNLQIYLKREDLNHTGAHKINHCMGEGLLAKHLGKKRLIAETGAGQHGVAVATAAAYFGLECEIHMGAPDITKQATNVDKMKILGAKIITVTEGNKGLKEAVDSAFSSYLNCYKEAIYCIGSAVGPHPFPMMIRNFQKVIGIEAREQFLNKTGVLPDIITACVGGGSNSIGLFTGFLNDPVKIVGVEAHGKGDKKGEHSAAILYGNEGVIHGFNSIVIQDNKGNPYKVHSVASGLDYPSIGPEHALLNELKKVEYTAVYDEEAIEAFFMLAKYEGIIPALESSHALAYAIKLAREGTKGTILVNLSGRGDKDVDYIVDKYGTDYLNKRK